jgi:tetracycline resistance efflux pump
MKTDETRAIDEGILFTDKQATLDSIAEKTMIPRANGKVSDLFVPVAILFGTVVIMTLITTAGKIEGPLTFSAILANLDVQIPLVFGGILSCVYAIIRMIVIKATGKEITNAIGSGVKTIIISVCILLLALITAETIKQLDVGGFLSSFINGGIAVMWLPIIFFAIAAGISYGTGSTFGTLVVLIPIGMSIMVTVEPTYIIAVLGAILGGAIFGEHQSPLSDTSILSAVGSGITALDHLNSQMPYAFSCLGISIIGYLVLGISDNIVLSMIVVLGLLAGVIVVFKSISNKKIKVKTIEA